MNAFVVFKAKPLNFRCLYILRQFRSKKVLFIIHFNSKQLIFYVTYMSKIYVVEI